MDLCTHSFDIEQVLEIEDVEDIIDAVINNE